MMVKIDMCWLRVSDFVFSVRWSFCLSRLKRLKEQRKSWRCLGKLSALNQWISNSKNMKVFAPCCCHTLFSVAESLRWFHCEQFAVLLKCRCKFELVTCSRANHDCFVNELQCAYILYLISCIVVHNSYNKAKTRFKIIRSKEVLKVILKSFCKNAKLIESKMWWYHISGFYVIFFYLHAFIVCISCGISKNCAFSTINLSESYMFARLWRGTGRLPSAGSLQNIPVKCLQTYRLFTACRSIADFIRQIVH